MPPISFPLHRFKIFFCLPFGCKGEVKGSVQWIPLQLDKSSCIQVLIPSITMSCCDHNSHLLQIKTKKVNGKRKEGQESVLLYEVQICFD